jgi:LmbE family N-acetylglucosaminyl deacetylase
VLRLAKQFPGSVFHWVTFSAKGARGVEAQHSARLYAQSVTLCGPSLHEFDDGFLPFTGAQVKTTFEELKAVSPNLIFTHNRRDAHQDHRLLAQLALNTFRNHLILEYEIPKYDGDMGQPNFFVPLDAEICEVKIRYLMEAFQSQRSKHWFGEDTFRAIMRLRGMECNAPSGHAEAFFCRKMVI